MLIVLLFGIVTDYAIFFMSRARVLLSEDRRPRDVGVSLVRQIGPIVVVAGATVAVGTAALAVASIGYLRAFGPALAIAVLVAMAVSATFVPAMLAVAGRLIFWPARLAPPADGVPAAEPRRRRSVRLAVRHPVVAGLVVLALVGAAASGLSRIAVGNTLVKDLPAKLGTAAEPIRRPAGDSRRACWVRASWW